MLMHSCRRWKAIGNPRWLRSSVASLSANGSFAQWRPVPRALPSSVRQLHTLSPFGPLRSWRTVIRVVHDARTQPLPTSGPFPSLQHPVHIEISEQRTDYATLRCAAIVILPACLTSSSPFHPFPRPALSATSSTDAARACRRFSVLCTA